MNNILNKKTALYNTHQKHQAKIVDFAGFDMPIHYGSQVEEHHAVRNHAGLFDVSHMVISDLISPVNLENLGCKNFLKYLLANDVSKISPGQALYSCMLNPNGGVIDDLIIYDLGENNYRLVTNAGTKDKDLAWIRKQAENFQVQINTREDLSILALQGPKSLEIFSKIFQPIMQTTPFHFTLDPNHPNWMIARTGYTGEEGIEIMLPHADAIILWDQLVQAGVHPCGLGARDTLRLEAGMNLYGLDMDETISPLESGLAWTVCFKNPARNFIGKLALENQKKLNTHAIQIGLVLEDKGVMRSHQKIFKNPEDELSIGEITSGSFSPSLNISIAMARVSRKSLELKDLENYCWVEIRNKKLKAKIIKLPFVKNGKPSSELKIPNATTRAAMEEARSMGAARFETPEELFNAIEKDSKK